jgi:hypothetical protein
MPDPKKNFGSTTQDISKDLVSLQSVLVDDDQLQAGEAAGLKAERAASVAQPAAPILRVEVRLLLVHLAFDGPRESRPNWKNFNDQTCYDLKHVSGP